MPKYHYWPQLKLSIGLIFFLIFIFNIAWALPAQASLFTIKEKILRAAPLFYDYVTQLLQNNDQEIISQARKLNLPQINLFLSQKDIAHFADIYSHLTNLQNPDIAYYQENNKWRLATMFLNGEKYKIKIKSHGLEPSGHRVGEFISFNVKLRDNKQINHLTSFNLIIRDRIQDKRLLVFDLARRFNIIVNEPQLVSVKINNWPEKLYYLEPKLDAAYLESLGRPLFQIFSNPDKSSQDKSSVLGFDWQFDEEKYKNDFDKIFQNLNYPEIYRPDVLKRFLQLNRTIVAGDSKKIIEFFDRDYIASYLAARTVSGQTGHGVAKINFYVFLDTASGKFYPSFTRDNVPGRLLSCQNCPPEQQMNYWEHLNARHRLLDILDQNDEIRQLKYQKIYNFIREVGGDIDQEHQKIVNADHRLHYLGWFRLLLSKFGYSIDLIPVGENLKILKEYLDSANPELEVYSTARQLVLVLRPRSMSALTFSDLNIGQPGFFKSNEQQKVRLRIAEFVDGKINEIKEKFFSLNQQSEKLDLIEGLKEVSFFDALGDSAERQERKYVFIFDFSSDALSTLASQKLNVHLINQIANSETTIKQLFVLKNLSDEIVKLLLFNNFSTGICEQWRREHYNLSLQCADDKIILRPGSYWLKQDLILPNGFKLVLSAGTKLYLAKDKSIFGFNGIDVLGTATAPVVITAADPNAPYGTVGILSDRSDQRTSSTISYLKQSHGNEDWNNGALFSGGLSIHYQDQVIIKNSQISNNHADDGMNIKYTNNVFIDRSAFNNNFADQVDFDYIKNGRVINSAFMDDKDMKINGDGLDLSGSQFILTNNFFSGQKDKGLSIGEETKVFVVNNKFINNNLGIAVKDSSSAVVAGNSFENNKSDIELYQKKAIWSGGTLYANESTLMNIKIQSDAKSSIKNLDPEFNLQKEIYNLNYDVSKLFNVLDPSQIK